MDFIDLSRLGFSNLWRTKLRSTLTILGVVIGIAALTSMISFGIGMQKNLTDSFAKNDLFTSLTVSSKKINLQELSEGNLESIQSDTVKPTELNDSLIETIKEIPGVVVAFPEIQFPVQMKLKGKETNQNINAVSMGMVGFYPFNEIEEGDFFSNDSAFEILVRERTLKDMGFIISRNPEDTIGKPDKILTDPDTLIGSSCEVITKVVDFSGPLSNPFMAMMGMKNLPVKDSVIPFVIKGIIPDAGEFGMDHFRGGIIMPLQTSKNIPNLGFESIWDLFGDKHEKGGYGSIYVRVKEMNQTKPLTDSLKNKGLNVYSFSEELKEIKKVFIIMDSFLGIIGLIALVVASLGIVNTMLMSILERTREIGIMKSIGGSEKEIKTIFFVEASAIGFIGGVFGIALGWGITRIANIIMNAKLRPQDLPHVDLFSFPWWLILGAVAFSVVLSLAAGLYPAIRAARIDPVEALRHE